MYAIIGLPGSIHHKFEQFHVGSYGSRKLARAAADVWLESMDLLLQEEHPVAWPQPLAVLSDRDAQKVRWRDGLRVYCD